ncbi:MAG TPA: membrane protein insertion efficiency factor YidD [Alphaproteobacteria bacterium]|nr:membrane protein insertion efficiency factor YidD [Alphaproteobacteria bacterium]
MKVLALLIDAAIRVYQWILAPVLGARCRYLPSCSDYAREAVGLHGPFYGCWLALRRICRCHPLGGHGLDPVPPAAERR